MWYYKNVKLKIVRNQINDKNKHKFSFSNNFSGERSYKNILSGTYGHNIGHKPLKYIYLYKELLNSIDTHKSKKNKTFHSYFYCSVAHL